MDVLYKNGNQELSAQFSLPLRCMVLLKTLVLALKKYFFLQKSWLFSLIILLINYWKNKINIDATKLHK